MTGKPETTLAIPNPLQNAGTFSDDAHLLGANGVWALAGVLCYAAWCLTNYFVKKAQIQKEKDIALAQLSSHHALKMQQLKTVSGESTLPLEERS